MCSTASAFYGAFENYSSNYPSKKRARRERETKAMAMAMADKQKSTSLTKSVNDNGHPVFLLIINSRRDKIAVFRCSKLFLIKITASPSRVKVRNDVAE